MRRWKKKASLIALYRVIEGIKRNYGENNGLTMALMLCLKRV